MFSKEHGAVVVHVVPLYRDNFGYVVEADEGVVLVDAGDAGPLLEVVERLGKPLLGVLVTHQDWDHVDGLEAVCAAWPQAQVFGPGMAEDGEAAWLGGIEAVALDTPGHQREHFAWYLPGAQVLFSGDALFLAGCGRIFGGTVGQMFRSFQRLGELPDATAVYCGHEYAVSNLAFAASLLPNDPGIAAQRARVEGLVAAGAPSVPGRMDWERQSNVFLRVAEPEVRRVVGAEDAAAAFAALRARRDRW